jgi:hypothetical protein
VPGAGNRSTSPRSPQAREGNSLLHKRYVPKERQPFRSCQQQTPQRPFISASLLAISFLALGFLLFPAPLQSIPSDLTAIAMSSLPFPRRFQSQVQLDSVRCILGWTAPAQAGKLKAGKIPLRDLAAGEFVLFNSYIMCGLVPPISSFFLLLLEEFGLQLHHLTPHSVLLVAVFAHFMEMFVGVRPCTTIFKHFYALVGTGKSKRSEIGAYYFQLRHRMAGSYIAAFSSSKWEDWREGWVIVAVDPHDHLELPTKGPRVTGAPGRPGQQYQRSSTRCCTGSRSWQGAA